LLLLRQQGQGQGLELGANMVQQQKLQTPDVTAWTLTITVAVLLECLEKTVSILEKTYLGIYLYIY
jgi:hypothetical protein